jgi:hypothetical protein
MHSASLWVRKHEVSNSQTLLKAPLVKSTVQVFNFIAIFLQAFVCPIAGVGEVGVVGDEG